MSKNKVVYGICPKRSIVENVVSNLKSDGFRNSDISVLFSETESSKEFAHKKSTKAPEGTATGATAGAVIGGTLGWLAGIGSLSIPMVGPLIAAGPIVGLLAGVGVGGTLGGIAGGLIGMGIPEYEAKRFEGLIKNGGILISVHCDNAEWIKKAKDILEKGGVQDIGTSTEAKADVKIDPKNRVAKKDSDISEKIF